jgi:hypothetical protein
MVMGSGLPAPIAVVVLKEYARESASTIEGKAALKASLEQLLKATNQKVASYE